MKKEELLDFYKNLYFHEEERKEKLASRLQIPLAIIFSIASLYGYFIKELSIQNITIQSFIFILFFIISILLFISSLVFFIKGFWGNKYELIPSAKTIEDYRQEMIELYKEYENSDDIVEEHFNQYLMNSLNQCSNSNTNMNDKRSKNLHRSNFFILLNLLPLAITFIVFTQGVINQNSTNKFQEIIIKKSSNCRRNNQF